MATVYMYIHVTNNTSNQLIIVCIYKHIILCTYTHTCIICTLYINTCTLNSKPDHLTAYHCKELLINDTSIQPTRNCMQCIMEQVNVHDYRILHNQYWSIQLLCYTSLRPPTMAVTDNALQFLSFSHCHQN